MPNQTTLAELVTDVAQRNGAKPAIIFADEPISYSHLEVQIELVANALAILSVRPSDRVAVMLPNIPEFVIVYYAILRLGAIVVPINVLYKAEEIRYVLSDSESKLLILSEDFYLHGAEAVKKASSVEQVIVVGQKAAPDGTIPWNTLIDSSAPRREAVEIKPEDSAVICYTSGTTGRSKGAILTHRNLIANCEQMASMERWPHDESGITLLVIPLFHIYAMNVCMNYDLRLGCTIVLMSRFEPILVLEQIQKYRCTTFLGVPPMYVAWVNTPDLQDYDLSSLRFVNSGAASLPVQVLNRFVELTGISINEGYGLTEAAPTTHSNAAGPWNKPGTIGPSIPGVEARLVDDENHNVPHGTEGEIIIRGDNVMAAYWRKPEATAEVLRHGWFHTGDIATMDEDGYYTIVDRKKDMINVGGFKVWPREVEEVLYSHPAVQEAAVVPMPDEYTGECPLAYIALRQGKSASVDDLIAYCKDRLASYKAPVQIEFCDELPKLPTGKVLRRILREEAWKSSH